MIDFEPYMLIPKQYNLKKPHPNTSPNLNPNRKSKNNLTTKP